MRAAVALLIACGTRTGLLSEDPPVDEPKCDAAVATPCAPLRFSVGIAESCQLAADPCGIDAEGLVRFTCPLGQRDCDAGATANEKRRVFALNRMGTGHLAAFCD